MCDYSVSNEMHILSSACSLLLFQYLSHSVDEILKCDHSNESCRAVLSCGAVYYAVQDDSNLAVWIYSKV